MLPLDSPRWAELRHAYGGASDIPEMLEQLEAVAQGRITLPTPEYAFQAEPWFSLWSALCHQGDVYTASYAAVPHVLRIAAEARQGQWEYFTFVASIEISRATSGPDIPADLISGYISAVAQIPELTQGLAGEAPEEVTRLLQHVGVEAEDTKEGDY